METDEKLYTKGFNNGYLLAEHEPELAALLVKNKNEHSDYFQGLVAGKQEHDIEKVREKFKGASHNQPPAKDISKNKSPKEDKDMDKER